MTITDFITLAGAEHHLGRALTADALARMLRDGLAVQVNDAYFVSRRWLQQQLDAAPSPVVAPLHGASAAAAPAPVVAPLHGVSESQPAGPAASPANGGIAAALHAASESPQTACNAVTTAQGQAQPVVAPAANVDGLSRPSAAPAAASGDNLVRAHTRHYPPGAHPTLRGDVQVRPHHRRRRDT